MVWEFQCNRWLNGDERDVWSGDCAEQGICVLAVTLVFGRDFMVKKVGKVPMD